MTTPYNQIDHYHCWQKETPPCGQKIKHFKCCLCEMPHPEITEANQAGYADGYKQGKFDAEVTAEYGEPQEALQDKN